MSRFPFTGKIAQAFRGISPFFPPRLFFWLEWLLVCLLIWQLSGLFWTVFSPSTRGVGLALPRPVGEGAQQSSEAIQVLFGFRMLSSEGKRLDRIEAVVDEVRVHLRAQDL